MPRSSSSDRCIPGLPPDNAALHFLLRLSRQKIHALESSGALPLLLLCPLHKYVHLFRTHHRSLLESIHPSVPPLASHDLQFSNHVFRKILHFSFWFSPFYFPQSRERSICSANVFPPSIPGCSLSSEPPLGFNLLSSAGSFAQLSKSKISSNTVDRRSKSFTQLRFSSCQGRQ